MLTVEVGGEGSTRRQVGSKFYGLQAGVALGSELQTGSAPKFDGLQAGVALGSELQTGSAPKDQSLQIMGLQTRYQRQSFCPDRLQARNSSSHAPRELKESGLLNGFRVLQCLERLPKAPRESSTWTAWRF